MDKTVIIIKHFHLGRPWTLGWGDEKYTTEHTKQKFQMLLTHLCSVWIFFFFCIKAWKDMYYDTHKKKYNAFKHVTICWSACTQIMNTWLTVPMIINVTFHAWYRRDKLLKQPKISVWHSSKITFTSLDFCFTARNGCETLELASAGVRWPLRLILANTWDNI